METRNDIKSVKLSTIEVFLMVAMKFKVEIMEYRKNSTYCLFARSINCKFSRFPIVPLYQIYENDSKCEDIVVPIRMQRTFMMAARIARFCVITENH